MSIYEELDPMAKHRTQFAFKGKRDHMAKVNMSNIAYPNQHIDIEIPHGSRDHVIVPETVKITFNLDITPTDKTRSVLNNVGRALVKKRCSCLVQKTLTLLTTQIFTIRAYRSLLERKRASRETTSRHTVGQWFKDTYGCKKGRWHGIDSDDSGKCC